MTTKPEWSDFFHEINAEVLGEELPSVNVIQQAGGDPFAIFVATLISTRTRDDVTLRTSRKLLEAADSPEKLIKLTEDEIEKKIYPSGFYRVKAKNLLEIAHILIKTYNSKVPETSEALNNLPGVGPKVANLILSLAFGQDTICVDTHVHRITNRMGWILTSTPEKTELELMRIVPKDQWNLINEVFVKFGQRQCLPASPHCSSCTFTDWCPKNGVLHSR